MIEGQATFSELLAEATVNGMRALDDETLSAFGKMGVFSACEGMISQKIEEIDWENSSLNLPEWVDFIDPVTRKRVAIEEMAHGLAGVAVMDAEFLFNKAQQIALLHGVEDPIQLKGVMQASGRTLLSVARLHDDKKAEVFETIQYPDRTPVILGRSVEAPILEVRADSKGSEVVDWTHGAKSWIRKNTISGRGCPAHTQIIEDGGRRTTLMQFFWDKIVDLNYSDAMTADDEVVAAS